MRTLLLILSLTIGLLSNDNYELKLYQSLLPELFQKENLIVYTQESDQVDIIQHSSILKISYHCSDADLVIGKKLDDLPEDCYGKPIFATSYRSYKNSENTFGAFYWRKGRPQVQFKQDVLRRYNLYLPLNLQKYAK